MPLNILIVDDEEYIRKGIISKINWDEEDYQLVGEAEDGAAAYEIIQAKPVDIVITDICMPQKDGFELIRDVMNDGKPIKFIIISGYDEFEYARSAMKYRVTEYLLKPTKETDLSAALGRMKKELQEYHNLEKQQRDLILMYNKKQLQERDEFLNKLLHDQVLNSYEYQQTVKLLHLKGQENYLVSVMRISVYKQTTANMSDDLVYFSMQNIFQEICLNENPGHQTIFFKNGNDRNEYVFLTYGNEDHMKPKLYHVLYPFMNALKQYVRIHATVGLGSMENELAQINSSYVNATFAVNERILKGEGKVIDYDEVNKQQNSLNLIKNDGKEFIRYFDERNKSGTKQYIRNLFLQIEKNSNGINHLQLQEVVLQLYVLLKKYINEKLPGRYNDLGKEYEVTQVLTNCKDIHELIGWFEELVETVFEHLSLTIDFSGKDVVNAVKQYIDMNYSQDIKLQYISDTYHIHPIYFSRIFKNVVGESFNSYLTKKRMEKAQELLQNPALKLNDISELVGYEDPKYFSKVFKKHFGTSPSKLSGCQK